MQALCDTWCSDFVVEPNGSCSLRESCTESCHCRLKCAISSGEAPLEQHCLYCSCSLEYHNSKVQSGGRERWGERGEGDGRFLWNPNLCPPSSPHLTRNTCWNKRNYPHQWQVWNSLLYLALKPNLHFLNRSTFFFMAADTSALLRVRL